MHNEQVVGFEMSDQITFLLFSGKMAMEGVSCARLKEGAMTASLTAAIAISAGIPCC